MNKIKDLWPGYKTRLISLVMALGPLAAWLGYQFDPEAVVRFIEDFDSWIVLGYGLLTGAQQATYKWAVERERK